MTASATRAPAWFSGGRRASPAQSPRHAASTTGASPPRRVFSAAPSAAVGISREDGKDEPFSLKSLDDREDDEDDVKDAHEEHRDGVEARERLEEHGECGGRDPHENHTAEEKQPVAGVPPDLPRARARSGFEKEREHAEEGQVTEDQEPGRLSLRLGHGETVSGVR